jgi:hypothetical protein
MFGDKVLPGVTSLNDKEAREAIIEALISIAILAQRTEMPKEPGNSIQASIAKMEARLPNQLSS